MPGRDGKGRGGSAHSTSARRLKKCSPCYRVAMRTCGVSQIACAEVERSEIRRTTFGVACKVEMSLVPVVGCYGPMPNGSGVRTVPAVPASPRSFCTVLGAHPLHPDSGPHDKNARARKRRRGASGDGRPRPNRNRTGRQERGGEGHSLQPYTDLHRPATATRECPSSVPPCAQPREPWAWPVNVAFSRPENHQTRSRRRCTADVPGTPA